jgi:threonine aldolase
MLSANERKLLRRSCTSQVSGFIEPTPAELFRQMAHWCEEHNVEYDRYGTGDLIEHFEQKVAALLGKPAAVFMPSGTMAQLASVRIWTERQNTQRFGLHATSHLDHHEAQAYQALFRLHGVKVGQDAKPILADDVAALAEPLGCLIVELPMREIGGRLPEWDELQALKSTAQTRGLPLHLDGARLWECRAFYGRSYAEIADGFDSVYVSLYKGIGGLAGAVLAGSEDFVAAARLWRQRMGGRLITQSPMLVSAAMNLDTRLAMMDKYYARALTFAEGLNRIEGIRTLPRVPQVNMLHVMFDGSVEALNEQRDALAATERCWLIPWLKEAGVPGWSVSEIYVGDGLLALSDEQVLPMFERIMTAVRGS